MAANYHICSQHLNFSRNLIHVAHRPPDEWMFLTLGKVVNDSGENILHGLGVIYACVHVAAQVL